LLNLRNVRHCRVTRGDGGQGLVVRASAGDLWPAGEIYRANADGPIVIYDHLADRWLLSQFNFPNHLCVAISRTSDPMKGTAQCYVA
jgi:hypothetical protein